MPDTGMFLHHGPETFKVCILDSSANPCPGWAKGFSKSSSANSKAFLESSNTNTQVQTFHMRLFMDRGKLKADSSHFQNQNNQENAKSYVSLFMEATSQHLRLTDDIKKSYFAYLHNNGQGSGSWLVTLAEKCLPYNQPTTLLL